MKANDNEISRFSNGLYLGFPGELAPELSRTLTRYTNLTVLKFLTSTFNLPSQYTFRV